MKVLISPISLEEARIVGAGGADIIDVKNTNEGSLGAQYPWIIREVVDWAAGSGLLVSATLGDLSFKPGTAAQAAYGVAVVGVKYVKVGLYDIHSVAEATAMMTAVRKACDDVDPNILVVAAGYADYRRFGGLNPLDIVDAAATARCNLVMVDTAIKDGLTLLDNMGVDEVRAFVTRGHQAGLGVALAGSIGTRHLDTLASVGTDIVGIRGAVCDESNRSRGIVERKVVEFMHQVQEYGLITG